MLSGTGQNLQCARDSSGSTGPGSPALAVFPSVRTVTVLTGRARRREGVQRWEWAWVCWWGGRGTAAPGWLGGRRLVQGGIHPVLMASVFSGALSAWRQDQEEARAPCGFRERQGCLGLRLV